YTVTYEQGAATSGTVPLDPSSPYAAGSTVIVLGNAGTLTETGSVFAGWNTAADGSGTNYAPGATFVISANTMLYPVFTVVKPVSYTVTYNHGAATSGSVPLDPSSPYAAGSTVIVLGNTGTLAETGSVFAGWNTAADGSGTSYAPGATFVIGANTVLYPVFTVVKPVTYTVTYDQGAATSGSVPVDVHSPYVAGTTVMVLGNSGNLAEFGYAFAGWNTAANGSGTSYAPGASFIINANIVLYPVFEKPLAITTTFLAGATAGETNYAQTLEGTGGTTPYTWSISAGSLPTGLSLNPSTGLISGTVSVTAQTVTFTVTLSDANGASTTKEFTITVCGSLSITTRFLDSAYPDEHDYAQLLEGTGGTRPYTWSISAGSLPSGLSLNPSTGLISGSVSRSATSETFTVTLSDANGASTTKQFTIEVNNRPYFICPNSGHAYSGHWFYFWAETFGSPGEQWGETGHLPKGVQFDPATGIFYGSPAPGSEGSYDITLSVENPWGSSSLSFTLDISS
ncbi:MAG: putative Ig domain-containing protein, partial [Acidimicrobiales bacterium]